MQRRRSFGSGLGLLGALLLLVMVLAALAPGRLTAGHPTDDEGLAPELQAEPAKPPRDVGPIPEVIEPDPTIQEMIDQVLTETVILYDGGLSGEWPVTIGGDPYTILSRWTYSGEPMQKATQYVGEHLADLGLPVEYHVWDDSTNPNVIGEITGATNPDEIYMIVAHLDSVPPGALAPGADDNASGSAGVMIAADILTQYDWDCTLRFAFFTGEEQGLLGSYDYAQRAFNQDEDIRGVLNMDMLGWNTPNSSPTMDLHARATIPASMDIAQLYADVISAYNLDLIPDIRSNGSGASDHASFWNFGYPAILVIEDFSDFNPYYHSTQDTLDKLDIDYFTDLVRGSVGTFAHLTGCLVAEQEGTLTGRVTNSDDGSPIAGAQVAIDDLPPVATNAQGYYTATLPAGTYTVTASAGGFLPQTVTDVEVIADTTTIQDFNLEPLVLTGTLTGRVTDAVTAMPVPTATVDISGTAPLLTDLQGYYTVTLPVGVYTVTVSAAGYYTQTVGEVAVGEGATTIQDFSLEPVPPPPDYPVLFPLVWQEP